MNDDNTETLREQVERSSTEGISVMFLTVSITEHPLIGNYSLSYDIHTLPTNQFVEAYFPTVIIALMLRMEAI